MMSTQQMVRLTVDLDVELELVILTDIKLN